jgi:hypothetical protein
MYHSLSHCLSEREKWGSSRGAAAPRSCCANPTAAHPSLVQRLQHSGTLGGGPHGGGHCASASTASFSSDGRLLISGSEDAVLKIWDVSAPHRAPMQSFDTGEWLKQQESTRGTQTA